MTAPLVKLESSLNTSAVFCWTGLIANEMDSKILIEPLPTVGVRSTLNLLDAYESVMTHLVSLERDWNSDAGLKSLESTWRLLKNLNTAVCQIPFHPRDYAPKGGLDLGDPLTKAAIRENFERAREVRIHFLEKNLLGINDDASGEFNQKEGREKIELMKEYVQRHLDHLKP